MPKDIQVHIRWPDGNVDFFNCLDLNLDGKELHLKLEDDWKHFELKQIGWLSILPRSGEKAESLRTTMKPRTFYLELEGQSGSGKSTFIDFIMKVCSLDNRWTVERKGCHALAITRKRGT